MDIKEQFKDMQEQLKARQDINKSLIERHYQTILEILLIMMIICALWQFYENKSTVDKCNEFWQKQFDEKVPAAAYNLFDLSLVSHIDDAEEEQDSRKYE